MRITFIANYPIITNVEKEKEAKLALIFTKVI